MSARIQIGDNVSDHVDRRFIGRVSEIKFGVARVVWEGGMISHLPTLRLERRPSETFSDVPGPVECGERWDEDRED